MGGLCNVRTCCRDYDVIKTGENYGFQISNINEQKEIIFLKNDNYLDNEQLITSKKYLQIINEFRENPSNYINESKSHNLLEIFMKLKPSKPLKLSENNMLAIIMYLIESQEKTTLIEKESQIKSMINNGNINNICVFQTITISDDINQNFWFFLEENEDDIDKILTINYDYVMIICLSIKDNKMLITFIFYDEVN